MRRDLGDAQRALVALLGEVVVVEELQLHRAPRQSERRKRDAAEHHGRAPAVMLGLGIVVGDAWLHAARLHGLTIRTSRICGSVICSLVLATRSTKACEDQ